MSFKNAKVITDETVKQVVKISCECDCACQMNNDCACEAYNDCACAQV